MSQEGQQEGFRDRLTNRGEDALGKLAQDLLENPLINGALARAFDAREKAAQAREAEAWEQSLCTRGFGCGQLCAGPMSEARTMFGCARGGPVTLISIRGWMRGHMTIGLSSEVVQERWAPVAAIIAPTQEAKATSTSEREEKALSSDCPPVDHSTHRTRCAECPRFGAEIPRSAQDLAPCSVRRSP